MVDLDEKGISPQIIIPELSSVQNPYDIPLYYFS